MDRKDPKASDPTVSAQQPQPDPTPHADRFRALYDAHFTFVWRCLRGVGLPEDAIDDAVQEVFLVAHRRLPDFRGDSTPRTWLYGILRRVAANQRRSQKRRGQPEPLDPQHLSPDASPEQDLQEGQRAAFVRDFVAGLDDRRRDVFVLSVLEQLPMAEVAEILGIPLNTAYTRRRAARQAFRAALRRKAALS